LYQRFRWRLAVDLLCIWYILFLILSLKLRLSKTKILLKHKGIAGLVWCAIWMFVASNKPEENRLIKTKEKEYILEETREMRECFEESESGAPWGSIMTSMPCIALFIGHSCSNWGTYLFLTSLPLYMKEVLKFDIKSVSRLE
jgi:hypothetical protein